MNEPAAAERGAATSGTSGRPLRVAAPRHLRAEDFLLGGWIALLAPLLVRGGNFGLLDTGRPLEGAIILASVAAALLCLVTGDSDRGPSAASPVGGWVGPLSGGIILVGVTGFSALSLPGQWNLPVAIAGLVVIGLVRFRVPAFPVATRRTLVTPFVLVSGSLFWSVIYAVIRPGGADITASQLRDALLANTPGAGAVALVLLAFSGVYYAMLVYAPRQIADREGGAVAWLARYGLFVVSVLFGLGWVNAFGL